MSMKWIGVVFENTVSFLSVFAVGFGYLLIVSSLGMKGSLLVDLVLLSSESCSISFVLMIDEISLMFSGVVLVISGSVSLYSKWYMNDEVFYWRFMMLIYLFVGSMLMLIFSANLVTLMLGWDGLGLVSFLLVCYYQNSNSLGASLVTVLMNRVGDVLILSSIGLMSSWGDWLVYNRSLFEDLGFCGILLVLAGMTKSAQMPFSSWLPAAMAAPTPVSSLVHSSTLVTAGVYLVIRCNCICTCSTESMEVLKLLSLMTLVMAGMAGVLESDFKKVIALSTLSQLSMMMFAVSVGLVDIAFFHLVTHATFKALLFLSAGVVIHSNMGCQDLRHLGQCWGKLPVSSGFMMVAGFSLCGLPFMSGFFSKDLIVEMSLTSGMDVWVYLVMLGGVCFTSWYTLRIIISVVFGCNKSVLGSVDVKECYNVIISYCLLFVCAVFTGVVLKSKMKILFYENFVDSLSHFIILFIPFYGGLWLLNSMDMDNFKWDNFTGSFVGSMWNLKTLGAQPLCSGSFMYGMSLGRCLDQGWLEKVGPQGSFESLGKLSQMNQYLQSQYFVKMVGVMLIFLVSLLMGSLALFLVV
nr:NADH dehydrogenase subunit 5 [Semimytilus algosus]